MSFFVQVTKLMFKDVDAFSQTVSQKIENLKREICLQPVKKSRTLESPI